MIACAVCSQVKSRSRMYIHTSCQNAHQGANASLVRSVGGSARHGAARGGHAAVVKLLIKAGADLEVAMRFGGSTLHTASPDCSLVVLI